MTHCQFQICRKLVGKDELRYECANQGSVQKTFMLMAYTEKKFMIRF